MPASGEGGALCLWVILGCKVSSLSFVDCSPQGSSPDAGPRHCAQGSNLSRSSNPGGRPSGMFTPVCPSLTSQTSSTARRSSYARSSARSVQLTPRPIYSCVAPFPFPFPCHTARPCAHSPHICGWYGKYSGYSCHAFPNEFFPDPFRLPFPSLPLLLPVCLSACLWRILGRALPPDVPHILHLQKKRRSPSDGDQLVSTPSLFEGRLIGQQFWDRIPPDWRSPTPLAPVPCR